MSFGIGIWGGLGPGHAAPRRAAHQAADAAEQLREATYAATEMERRLDKLSMICMAMWAIIQEKMNVTEEDLMERVKQIDLMDGQVDGKMKRRELAQCPSCGRIMSPRHPRCIYCGAEKLNMGVFDDIL